MTQGHLAIMPHMPIASALKWTRVVALTSTLLLIALGLAWELALAPTGRGTLVLKVLPLLLALPGLAKGRLYTSRWVSLLVWLYVAEGLLRMITERGWVPALAGSEVLLALALFGACAAHVRLQLRRVAS